MSDVAGAMAYLRSLPITSGKIALFGTCSGGRHAYLAACRLPDVDAVIDCWGGRVVMSESDLNPNIAGNRRSTAGRRSSRS